MTGEEAGPSGPKLVRLMYFVGAGSLLCDFVLVICTAAINKWRDLQRKSIQQQQHRHEDRLSENSSKAVHKAVE